MLKIKVLEPFGFPENLNSDGKCQSISSHMSIGKAGNWPTKHCGTTSPGVKRYKPKGNPVVPWDIYLKVVLDDNNPVNTGFAAEICGYKCTDPGP